jgi:Tol biopolymer transport system component
VQPAQTKSQGTRTVWWAAAATVGVLALAGLGGWRWIERGETRTIRLTNPRQVTFTSAVETAPTWSPDGGRIAYVSDQSGNGDIWVAPAAGGAAVNLTADHSGVDSGPEWSPDGNQIAFVSERDGGGVYVMPAIGGRPERISPQGNSEGLNSLAWSADGTELAHMRREPEANFIEIVSLGTRESRRLRVPGDSGNRHDLSWSPDGRLFAYVRAASRGQEQNRLWLLRVADGQALGLTDGTTGDWNPMWSADGRTLYFISNRGGTQDLWQQRLSADGVPEGDPLPLTVGVGMQWAALSSGGGKLAYSRGRRVANVWRVPIPTDGEAGWPDAEQLTFDEAFVESLDVHEDSGRLVISSDRGGSRDLWLTAPDGTDMRRLTTDRGPDTAPRFSPDGKRIAFHSSREGNLDIWVLPTDGGPAVQLTRNPLSAMFPAWSPDGAAIAYYASTGPDVNAFVVPADGGEPRQITTGPVSKYFPQWSPDGKWMYYASQERAGASQVFRKPAAGGSPVQVTTQPVYYYRISHDGTRMYFPGTDRGSNDLWELTLADGRERRLTRFVQKPGSLGGSALAASKTHLYFAWRNDVGDIWVMDVVPDDER